jgi:hypothetical protein
MELVKSDNEAEVHEIENVLLQLSHELRATDWVPGGIPRNMITESVSFSLHIDRHNSMIYARLSIATKLIIKSRYIGALYTRLASQKKYITYIQYNNI